LESKPATQSVVRDNKNFHPLQGHFFYYYSNKNGSQ